MRASPSSRTELLEERIEALQDRATVLQEDFESIWTGVWVHSYRDNCAEVQESVHFKTHGLDQAAPRPIPCEPVHQVLWVADARQATHGKGDRH